MTKFKKWSLFLKRLKFTSSIQPELIRLKENYPDPEKARGKVISWVQFEGILGYGRLMPRFKTVMNAWRKDLKNNANIWTRADLVEDRGIGLRILTHEEQVRFTKKRYREAGRRIVDGHAASASADESKLSPEARREKEHNVMAGRHLHAAMIESRKFLPKATKPPETKPNSR